MSKEKLSDSDWWRAPAGSAACALLGLPKDASRAAAWVHMLERIAAALKSEVLKPTHATPLSELEKESLDSVFAKLLARDEDDDRAGNLVLRLVTTSAVATAEELALLRRRGWVPVAPQFETPGNGLIQ
jgi:hypothetical protein